MAEELIEEKEINITEVVQWYQYICTQVKLRVKDLFYNVENDVRFTITWRGFSLSFCYCVAIERTVESLGKGRVVCLQVDGAE